MKKNILYMLLLPVIWGGLAACNKQLNVLPTTQEVDGNIIVDVNSASTALNGVYYRFAASGVDFNSIPSTLWADAKEAYPSELSGMFSTRYGGSDLSLHIPVALSPEPLTMWSYGYNLVNAANGFLENIAPVKSIEDSAKQEMIAEAKFLRAYANSYLLLNFGQYYDTTSAYGIILRNQFVSVATLNLPRTPVGVVYDSILADLNNAIPHLPTVNVTKAGTNEWAGKLLEARVLMNRAAAGDYATVISLTSDIITNSPFTLEPNVEDIFRTKDISSNEVMLGVQPYTVPQQTYKFNDYLHLDQYIVSDSMMSLFNGDPRRSWTYFLYAAPFGQGNLGLFTKYYPGDTSNLSPSPIMEYSYAFRLTEAYLLEAEALVASGGSMSTARSLLETVLGHAGITDFSNVAAAATPAELQLLIIEEEMKNFVGEDGQDWLALRRLPFATVQTIVPTLKTIDQFIMPIPQTEIEGNGLIKQNPSY
jgi:starch-binding outer membrane protein, SusD/RagB family